jgi:hypothetical protein
MLDRIPELQVLANHPRIARALASGKAHKLYRVLWWGRIFGWFRDHRPLVDSLLAQRRLFLEPMASAPGLFTLNGIGTRIYGNEDVDPQDGTGIGTLFFTFLFMPLFPLCQYLVISEGRSFSFFGKVPFGSATYLWRQLVVIGVSVGVVTTAYSTWEKARHNDVVVVNGLSNPVMAVIDDRPMEIPALDRRTRHLETGSHRITIANTDGSVLEEGAIDLGGGQDVVAWNVLGAAPLFEQKIAYSLKPMPSAEPPDPQVFCGESQVIRNSVDFTFREPPDSVDLPSGRSVVWRTLFDVAPGGWHTCVGFLLANDDPTKAASIACGAADVSSFEDLNYVQASMIAAGQDDDLLQWLEKKIESSNGVELHRARQEALRRQGRIDEMRMDYLARYREAPESADAAYLWARTLPRESALRELPALRRKWPDNVYLIRSHAWHLQGKLKFAEALPLWEQLGNDKATTLEKIEALIALDRADEALSLAQNQEIENLEDAVFFTRVAMAAGQQPSLATVADLAMDPAFARAMLLARSSGEVNSDQLAAITDPDLRGAVEVTMALHNDGAQALNILRKDGVDVMLQLDTDSKFLLLGEATHASDDELAAAIAVQLPTIGYYSDAVQLIQGEVESDRLEELPVDLRSLVELAMSRRPGISTAEQSRLRNAARRDNVMNTVVDHAVVRWPS